MPPTSAANKQLASRGSSFIHTGSALLLALFVLTLFGHLLFTNRVLASGDILLYFTPYRDYAAAAFRNGRIPLWNPYSFLGVPFLANPQAAVLYPPHWPLSWLPATKQIYWSAAIHAWFLAFGGYMLMRHWQKSALAGLTTGAILAGSGFYGGLLGHINQMNAAAWLPWLLLPLFAVGNERKSYARLCAAIAFFALCVAMMLLAGHTQTAYINLFGIGIWTIIPWRKRVAERLSVFVAGSLLGALIAAAQLLPTLELSTLGLRSGGLSYGEASSFSLRPLHLLWTLLPSYGLVDLGVIFGPAYSEFIAYIGLLGLLLATLGLWRGGGATRAYGLLFAFLGLFLALGRWNPIYFALYTLVPGFNLFRTPARWMMLYTFGVSLLAGVGVDYLRCTLEGLHWGAPTKFGRTRSFLVPLLLLLLAAELLFAARALPHRQTTAPEAVYDLRTAPAHLLTEPARRALGPAAAGRFLSMSTIEFDPGDMADYRHAFMDDESTGVDSPQLDEKAFTQLVIAQKAQEILAPNLPLFWRIPAVDGFDGGVLPLQRYIQALSLFIPPEEIVPDGRLREQVKEVPRTDLLNLLNVQYIITDKVRDLWFDGIYYDRQIGAILAFDRAASSAKINIDIPQPFEATRLDLIGSVADDAAGESDAWQNHAIAVARVEVQAVDGGRTTFALRAGNGPDAHFADGWLDSTMAAAAAVEIAYRDVEGGRQEYRAGFDFTQPLSAQRIEIALDNTASDAVSGLAVTIRAATLVDERTGTFLPLVVSDRGRFARVHSGDVKIYENVDLLPRAYLVHQVVGVGDADEALQYLQAGELQPSESAVAEGVASFTTRGTPSDSAEIVSYRAERVEIRTRSAEGAFLVLSDSYYPGWSATIDHGVEGAVAEIVPTNYLFRGVAIPAGEHTVVFEYSPLSWQRGRGLSIAGVVLWLILLGVGWVGRSRA